MDEVSNGRAQYCIGAGWNVREHAAYSWEFPGVKERCDRLEEACELTRKLVTSDELVNYQGKYYNLINAPFSPNGANGCHIPIMVGGKGEKRTLRTCAKYGDICNLVGVNPQQVAHKKKVLAQHCEAVGRDLSEIKMSAHVPMRIIRDEEHARRARRVADWLMIGSVNYVIDRAKDFIDAGCEEFMLQSNEQRPEVYQQLNEEIFSAFD